MDNKNIRDWQEGWYEIGLKHVQELINPFIYNINDLIYEIKRIKIGEDVFNKMYPLLSERIAKLEEKDKEIEELKSILKDYIKLIKN